MVSKEFIAGAVASVWFIAMLIITYYYMKTKDDKQVRLLEWIFGTGMVLTCLIGIALVYMFAV